MIDDEFDDDFNKIEGADFLNDPEKLSSLSFSGENNADEDEEDESEEEN